MKNNIRNCRNKAGLSQQALADGCNTVKSKISALENGKQELTLTWMQRISGALTEAGHPTKPNDLLLDEHKSNDLMGKITKLTDERIAKVESIIDAYLVEQEHQDKDH
jgi:predicted transcriptional regulator